jgi:von Willebrand factor A domain-containing protein 7
MNFRNVGAITVMLLLGSLLSAKSSLAFKPDEAGHLGITSAAILNIAEPVGGVRFRFSHQALMEIRDANISTDSPIPPITGDFFIPEKHFDNEEFFASTTRLLNLKNYIISQITSPSPNGRNARIALGGALHTIQDFYAHTNWVEMGNTSIDTRLGRTTIPKPASTLVTSPVNDPGVLLPTQLTSGYFITPPYCSAPRGKTRHGSPVCPTGLNKDDSSRPGYQQARNLAILASQDFIYQILRSPGVAGNSRAIRALMGL